MFVLHAHQRTCVYVSGVWHVDVERMLMLDAYVYVQISVQMCVCLACIACRCWMHVCLACVICGCWIHVSGVSGVCGLGISDVCVLRV